MYKNSAKDLFDNKTYIYMTECLSTNDFLLKILKKKSYEEGTIVHTSYQTKGRGQRNNNWLSEKNKNLTFSFLLSPNIKLSSQFLLHILTSISLYKSLISFNINNVSIKWPNDIYVKEKKIAGILIENLVFKKSIHRAVVGIGLNVNQTNFNNLKATSIVNEIKKEVEISKFLQVFKDILMKEYLKVDSLDQITYYKKKLMGYKVEREYLFKSDIIKGKIMDVLLDGSLIVKSNHSLMKFNFGDIRLI